MSTSQTLRATRRQTSRDQRQRSRGAVVLDRGVGAELLHQDTKPFHRVPLKREDYGMLMDLLQGKRQQAGTTSTC